MGQVSRALSRWAGTVERGSESIAGARERRPLLGIQALQAAQGLELGQKRGRLLDIQTEALERQEQEMNRPVTFGDIFSGSGPLQAVHNIDVLPDIRRMTGYKFDRTQNQWLDKEGRVLTRRDMIRLAPAFEAAILSTKDVGKYLEDQVAETQMRMAGAQDPAEGQELTAQLQEVQGQLAEYEKDPLPFLNQQLGELIKYKGAILGQAPGADMTVLDQGIERVQGQIDAIQKGRAKYAEKVIEHDFAKKLASHKARLKKQEKKGDLKVSDYKGVIQTILGFYKDTSSVFADMLTALKSEDLTDAGMFEIAETALDKLRVKAEDDPIAKKHLTELEDAYTNMLRVAGITPRQVKKEEEPETIRMRFNPETMDF